MRPRTALSLVTTSAPIFFARNQSAALLMVASGDIVVTSVPFCLRMLSMVMAPPIVWPSCACVEDDAGQLLIQPPANQTKQKFSPKWGDFELARAILRPRQSVSWPGRGAARNAASQSRDP